MPKTRKAQDFNRGQSSRIFKEVHAGEDIIVLRNSEPHVAIISYEKYLKFIDNNEGDK